MALMLLFMLTDALVKFSQVVLAGMFLTWLAVTVALVLLLCRRLDPGPAEPRGHRPAGRVAVPRAGQQSDQPGATRRGDRRRRPGVSRGGPPPGRRGRWAGFRWNRPRRARTGGGGSSAACRRPAISANRSPCWPRWCSWRWLCHLLIPTLGSAANRLLAPWTFVPSVGSVEIVEVTPGDADVLIGTSLEITARINNPDAKPHEATAWITTADGQRVGPADDGRRRATRSTR